MTASRVRLTQGEARAIGNSMKAIWLGHHVPANAAREIVAACALVALAYTALNHRTGGARGGFSTREHCRYSRSAPRG